MSLTRGDARPMGNCKTTGKKCPCDKRLSSVSIENSRSVRCAPLDIGGVVGRAVERSGREPEKAVDTGCTERKRKRKREEVVEGGPHQMPKKRAEERRGEREHTPQAAPTRRSGSSIKAPFSVGTRDINPPETRSDTRHPKAHPTRESEANCVRGRRENTWNEDAGTGGRIWRWTELDGEGMSDTVQGAAPAKELVDTMEIPVSFLALPIFSSCTPLLPSISAVHSPVHQVSHPEILFSCSIEDTTSETIW
ncbi:hypothetical protein B0H14DRAFT_2640008 [Mycena olivaceomarginata]|nr:hypothetical protein B0H14DRAFT_2640008 [Mycena olivaceomarginata]